MIFIFSKYIIIEIVTSRKLGGPWSSCDSIHLTELPKSFEAAMSMIVNNFMFECESPRLKVSFDKMFRLNTDLNSKRT